MNLRNIYKCGPTEQTCRILYELLAERTADQSISHCSMPSYEQHVEFVNSVPYKAWYLIHNDDEIVGSIYLSKQREVGLFLFQKHAGKGYGAEALAQLRKYWPGKMLANVSPRNSRSIEFFKDQGFKLIQETYALR
jgi:RimJ/RimL family protein N-acetyltransferase